MQQRDIKQPQRKVFDVSKYQVAFSALFQAWFADVFLKKKEKDLLYPDCKAAFFH